MAAARMTAIRDAHRLFEYEVTEAARELDAVQRRALVRMLHGLRTTSVAKAQESYRKNKWMNFAYWRVVAVYAGHFARLIQRAGGGNL
jgi:hypothetical protein